MIKKIVKNTILTDPVYRIKGKKDVHYGVDKNLLEKKAWIKSSPEYSLINIKVLSQPVTPITLIGGEK